MVFRVGSSFELMKLWKENTGKWACRVVIAVLALRVYGQNQRYEKKGWNWKPAKYAKQLEQVATVKNTQTMAYMYLRYLHSPCDTLLGFPELWVTMVSFSASASESFPIAKLCVRSLMHQLICSASKLFRTLALQTLTSRQQSVNPNSQVNQRSLPAVHSCSLL